MDRLFVGKGCGYILRRKKWLFLIAAFGFSGYGVYRIYQSPSMADKRKKLAKIMGALISLAEAVTEIADTVGVVSRDTREFLQSDTNQIPKTLKQISKITISSEFFESLTSVTQAVTSGLSRGYQTRNEGEEDCDDSCFADRVIDKLFAESGSGFASIVVGSFARNLVMAYYSSEPNPSNSELDSTHKWVAVVSDDKCRKLIGDCVQQFVSTAFTIYLEKTMDVNPYNEFFSSLTNPKHEPKLCDMLVSVCNGAVETLVKTSHHVLTTSNTGRTSVSLPSLLSFRGFPFTEKVKQKASFLCRKRSQSDEDRGSGWMRKFSSTLLSVPTNRNFVLDVTGRVTVETVRSFMEFLLEKVYSGVKKCADMIHETVYVKGLVFVRYVVAETPVIATICFSVWLHILGGVRDDKVSVY